jgi:acyl-CoA synthetase (AMP-forming)/AMP-acid ligase II
MTCEDLTYSFAQLYDMAGCIAGSLAANGIGQGDHVGIYLRNHWSYIPIYYALSMAGAVAVPLNYMLRSAPWAIAAVDRLPVSVHRAAAV